MSVASRKDKPYIKAYFPKPKYDWSKLIKWDEARIYDLSQPLSIHTPPFPTYPPFKMYWIKVLPENNVDAQAIETAWHIGTHMDGPLHFDPAGASIDMVPLDHWVGEGVIVDISDEVEDLSIYTSEMIERKLKEHNLELKPGDILIIHTGYHKYQWDQPTADTVRYQLKHPGPTKEFAKWCVEKKIKWTGVDAVSQDHPLNTVIRKVRPDIAELFKEKFGKPVDEVMPWPENYQVLHTYTFPRGVFHAENLGGEITKVLNKRCLISGAPILVEGAESAFARIFAICNGPE